MLGVQRSVSADNEPSAAYPVDCNVGDLIVTKYIKSHGGAKGANASPAPTDTSPNDTEIVIVASAATQLDGGANQNNWGHIAAKLADGTERVGDVITWTDDGGTDQAIVEVIPAVPGKTWTLVDTHVEDGGGSTTEARTIGPVTSTEDVCFATGLAAADAAAAFPWTQATWDEDFSRAQILFVSAEPGTAGETSGVATLDSARLVVSVAAMFEAVPDPDPDGPSRATLEGGIVDGMGVHQALAESGGVWFSGADVSFVHRSEGSGWAPFGAGHTQVAGGKARAKVGGLVVSGNYLVALVGNAGTVGIYRRDLTSGEWSQVTTAYGTETEGSGHPRPWVHPCVAGNGKIYTGAVRASDGNHGLLRLDADGTTPTEVTWFGGDRFPRALCADPTDANTVWIATDTATDPAVFEVSTLDTTATKVRKDNVGSGAPNLSAAYDISVLEDPANAGSVLVFVAAGTAGLWRYSEASNAWTSLAPSGSDFWANIHAEVNAGTVRLVAAAVTEGQSPTSLGGTLPGAGAYRRCVIRSTDGGASWDDITGAANIDPTVWGDDDDWVQWNHELSWKANSNLGGNNWFPSETIVLGTGECRIAGKEGVWRCADIWAATPTWRPDVKGLGSTINWSVTTDGVNVAAGDTDNALWLFTNSGDDQPDNTLLDDINVPAGASNGFSTWIHEGRVLLGRGFRSTADNKFGEVVVVTDPLGADSLEWSDL